MEGKVELWSIDVVQKIQAVVQLRQGLFLSFWRPCDCRLEVSLRHRFQNSARRRGPDKTQTEHFALFFFLCKTRLATVVPWGLTEDMLGIEC